MQPPHRHNATMQRSMAITGQPTARRGMPPATASTAAGARVSNASYNGLERGTARGGSPASRLAIYKACTTDGCPGSLIRKAMDDAIRDGVDIISVSIGASSSDFLSDSIAIGALHAEQKGVLVVCSAGNDGPASSTIVNTAPWMLTVAASTIDRGFNSPVVLGNGKVIQGSAINFSKLKRSRTYPLVFGADAASESTPAWEASNCYPGSLNKSKVAGKIVVCINNDTNISRKVKKLVAEDAKAKGLILISEEDEGSFSSGSFPFSEINNNLQARRFLSYMNRTKEATATILPTIDVPHYKPAPVVAYFSSRGPGPLTENILKPDIMAPGVSILAAVTPKDSPAEGKQGIYALASGTSMACPHVSDAAALIKSVHRNWSSSMIKSAIMTTATIEDNLRRPFTNSSHLLASPHATGVGEINPIKALNPGLLFEMTSQDHLRFLCFYGYPDKIIRSMSNTNFTCPKVRSEKLISNINHPSVSIGRFNRKGKATRSITRIATNVGASNSTYQSRVHATKGLKVKVVPKKIVFSQHQTRLPFKIIFRAKEATQGYNFGYVTWSDVIHTVRLVFAVNVV